MLEYFGFVLGDCRSRWSHGVHRGESHGRLGAKGCHGETKSCHGGCPATRNPADLEEAALDVLASAEQLAAGDEEVPGRGVLADLVGHRC